MVVRSINVFYHIFETYSASYLNPMFKIVVNNLMLFKYYD